MADRYWVGGTGTWDTSDTTHWSLTSGGASGAAAPTSSDNVIFDSASNATGYTVTSTTGVCASATFGQPASGNLTLANGFSFTASGNVSFASGVVAPATGTLTYASFSGTRTITTNGFVIPSIVTNGAMVLQLLDALNLGNNLSFNTSTGTLDTNGFDVTFTNASTHSLQSNNSSIVFGSNLTINGPSTAVRPSCTINTNITVGGTLTIAGSDSTTKRIIIESNTRGTQRTITAAAIVVSNADFQDIAGAGAASWNMSAASGGSGNCGGNTMQALGDAAFTTPADQHWVKAAGAGGSWSDATAWTSRVPLPQDDVFMDNAFGTSQTVTADMPRLGKSISWTGATWTTALTWAMSASSGSSIFGSLTMIAGLTMTGTAAYTFEGRGNFTFTSQALTFERALTLNAPTGTLTLGGNLTLGVTRRLTITSGEFAVSGSNYVISTGLLTLGGGTLTLGSATHLITGTGTTAWNVTSGTLNANTSTIKITDTSGTAITFVGGGKTYNNVWFSRGASVASNTISGSNTFADFKDDGSAAHSILFTAGTTQTVTTFTVSGTVGNVITINSTTTGVHNLIKAGGGTISRDYLNIQHSITSPAITWYAGANSVNNQGDATVGRGWIFTVAPTGVQPTFFPFLSS